MDDIVKLCDRAIRTMRSNVRITKLVALNPEIIRNELFKDSDSDEDSSGKQRRSSLVNQRRPSLSELRKSPGRRRLSIGNGPATSQFPPPEFHESQQNIEEQMEENDEDHCNDPKELVESFHGKSSAKEGKEGTASGTRSSRFCDATNCKKRPMKRRWNERPRKSVSQ